MSGAFTTWGLGDYPRMAERLEAAAHRAVDLAEVTTAERVLDVACGTGNAALVAAERGATVAAVDTEPRLLEIGRERAEARQLAVEWGLGDAEALPARDGDFDTVLSTFGAMYAPDHEAAAGELARVCAPGGRVALASWTPGGFMPAMGAALAEFLPPPVPGSGPPSRWGDRDALGELLSGAGLVVESARDERVTLHFDGRMEAVAFLVRTAGHVLAERERLVADGRWETLLAALAAVVERFSQPGPRGVALPLDYLLALARPA